MPGGQGNSVATNFQSEKNETQKLKNKCQDTIVTLLQTILFGFQMKYGISSTPKKTGNKAAPLQSWI